MSDDDLEVVEHFKARRKNGRTVDMTVYHVPVEDGEGVYVLILEKTKKTVISKTYAAPQFPRESIESEFNRDVERYLESKGLSR